MRECGPAELADQQYQAFGLVDGQNGGTVADIIGFAHLMLPASVASAEIEAGLSQDVVAVRKNFQMLVSDAITGVGHVNLGKKRSGKICAARRKAAEKIAQPFCRRRVYGACG
jgi:hypothetical protein